MDVSHLLDALNPAQREAVSAPPGHYLVLAGAGSGKTRVLTHRIAWLNEVEGVPTHGILAVTFTNKAAGEMRARADLQLRNGSRGMWIGTFHGLAHRLLRLHWQEAKLPETFQVLDSDDQIRLVKRVVQQLELDETRFPPRQIAWWINAQKDEGRRAEHLQPGEDIWADTLRRAYVLYQERCDRAGLVDFAELLLRAHELLRDNPALLAHYRHRFRELLIDEFQDTNAIQYAFVRVLAGDTGHVFVVGDDDQAIYGWRGADIRNILDFERDFPSAQVVRLEENYRSTAPILDLANVVIAANEARRGKTLRATRSGGEKVVLLEAADDRDEAEAIAEALTDWRATRGELRDCAVLYRTNSQSRSMEEAMRKAGLPYRLVGAVRFYDRREIKDLVAWLRLVANPADDEAFRRALTAPRRGVGETTLELLANEAREAGVPLLEQARRIDAIVGVRPATKQALTDLVATVDRMRALATDTSVDQLLLKLVADIGYDQALRAEGPEGLERLDNVRELVTSAAEVIIDDGGEVGLRPLDHFLQRATLVTGLDQLGPDADAVTMMTVHTAKGLEYSMVCVTGLEDGLFPLSRAFDDPATLEEERRLLYVAITRAGERLLLSWAHQRRRNGELLPSIISSFIRAVPAGHFEARRTLRMRATSRLASPYGLAGGPPSAGGSGGGRYGRRDEAAFSRSGTPDWKPRAGAAVSSFVQDEDASQLAPSFVRGERVSHRTFGSGTICEVSGSGKEAKVTVDFDDEGVGRKRLVIAFAGLERGMD
ncbi:MAG TPA: UvrD-helicase domain-containing protein [Burkholderiaceae bacterium]|nr:UvrD-helicase domain-containing protein [Burkholderiaceae bacterium]